MKEIESLLRDRFKEAYGDSPEASVWAPGRVNIIGEHTDYNDGFVFPIAIGKRIYAAASATGSNEVTLRSENLRGEVAFNMNSIQPSGDWGDYPKGIVAKLLKKEFPIGGFNAYFMSDLPIGAGVSSSAAIEVVVCYLLQKLFGFSMPPEDSALLCQQAEHEFAGTRCGIMDQFISVIGQAENALFLDCRSLDYKQIPMALGDYIPVACDSRVERGLATSAYNERREQCEEGVRILSNRFPGIRSLRDATPRQLEECSAEMSDTVFRRCRHIISENERVLASLEAMKQNDVAKLGELMNLSHNSLRDDYEVSCRELDLLVDTARDMEGVLGSRLTGAGFGGSTISLTHRSSLATFQAGIAEAYLEAFDVEPRIFECSPSDGAHRGNSI